MTTEQIKDLALLGKKIIINNQELRIVKTRATVLNKAIVRSNNQQRSYVTLDKDEATALTDIVNFLFNVCSGIPTDEDVAKELFKSLEIEEETKE